MPRFFTILAEGVERRPRLPETRELASQIGECVAGLLCRVRCSELQTRSRALVEQVRSPPRTLMTSRVRCERRLP
jgi:hypothetical protein